MSISTDMVRVLLLIAALLAASPVKGAAALPLEIFDYNVPVDFTAKPVLKIQPGDNPSYKELQYADDAWKTVAPPVRWNRILSEKPAICWFRLHVIFPNGDPPHSLAVALGTICDVDEVFFNGTRIGKTGDFPPARKSAYDRKRIYEMPARLIRPGRDNVLAIRVAGLIDYRDGLYQGPYRFASLRDLQSQQFREEVLDLFFIVCFMFVAVYLGIMFARGTANREFLMLALLALASAIYLVMRTQFKYFFFDDFIRLKRIEHALTIIMPLVLMEYILRFYRLKRSLVCHAYSLVSFASIAGIMLSHDLVVWKMILHYVVEPSWVMPLLYTVYVPVRYSSRRSGSGYQLAALIILWATVINDTLVNRGLYDFPFLSRAGFLSLIFISLIILRGRLVRLMGEVDRLKNIRPKKIALTAESVKKVEQAMDYLAQNYMFEISREGLAEAVGINHDYLGKVFREHTGKKINEYINELRVRKASELLRETGSSVVTIAYEVGFMNLSTFYRIFNGIMKESPQGYRERHRQAGKPQ